MAEAKEQDNFESTDPEVEFTPEAEQELFDGAEQEEVKAEEPEVEAQPEPEPEPQPEPETPHHVPLSALLDEREKRQKINQQLEALQQQMQQQQAWEAEQQRLAQEQQQLPDMFENPEYYQQQVAQVAQQLPAVMQQIQQQQRALQIQRAELKGDMALARAQAQDPETFNKAWETLEKRTVEGGDPSWRNYLLQTAMQGGDPGQALLDLYKREHVTETVGDDPDAFVEKAIEEKLKDPEYLQKVLAKVQGNASPEGSEKSVVKLPPSLNKAGGTGGNVPGGITDGELWEDTLTNQ